MQIQGSKTQAQDGTLVILVSGDRSLFDDCQSCFQAMGKNSFYLGEVGNATKMNLVLQVNISLLFGSDRSPRSQDVVCPCVRACVRDIMLKRALEES